MNSNYLRDLYIAEDSDETVTPYDNEIGFSVIRKYPKDTLYYKDDRRMFIKIANTHNGFYFSVDMTAPEDSSGDKRYVLVEGNEYKNRVTNFFSNNDEHFIFDTKTMKVFDKRSSRSFTINEFINILAKNHLMDRYYWKRKFNTVIELLLKFLFWLSDRSYDRVKVLLDKFHFSKENTPVLMEKNTEPFFKYFNISRNLIFFILILTLLLIILSNIFSPFKGLLSFGDFSLSNPTIVLLIFILLFLSEKLSLLLNAEINNFFKKNSELKTFNYIEWLVNYQSTYKFNLKI